jgi:hypothetical protein
MRFPETQRSPMYLFEGLIKLRHGRGCTYIAKVSDTCSMKVVCEVYVFVPTGATAHRNSIVRLPMAKTM